MFTSQRITYPVPPQEMTYHTSFPKTHIFHLWYNICDICKSIIAPPHAARSQTWDNRHNTSLRHSGRKPFNFRFKISSLFYIFFRYDYRDYREVSNWFGTKVQIHLTFKPLLLEVMNQCPLFDQLVTDYVWWNTFRKKKIDMNLKVPREEDKKSVQISKENVWLSSM